MTLMSRNTQYTSVTPSRPIDTTAMPMTAPLLNATLSAEFRLVCAFTTVRELARTAMFMPMNPASADPTAPIRYAMAVDGTPCPASGDAARDVVVDEYGENDGYDDDEQREQAVLA